MGIVFLSNKAISLGETGDVATKNNQPVFGKLRDFFYRIDSKYRKSPEVHGLFSSERLWKPPPPLFKLVSQRITLPATNISPAKALFKILFLIPRWDMLVPWRGRPHHQSQGFPVTCHFGVQPWLFLHAGCPEALAIRQCTYLAASIVWSWNGSRHFGIEETDDRRGHFRKGTKYRL